MKSTRIKSIEIFMDNEGYFYAKTDKEFFECSDKAWGGIPSDLDDYLTEFFGLENKHEMD